MSQQEQTHTTKGILYPQKLEQPVSHWQAAPPDDLKFLIEHYWGVFWDLRGQPPRQQEILSYPSVHMSFEAQSARFVGIVRGMFIREISGLGWVFGAKFQPGVFSLVSGVAAAQSTDRTTPISEILGESSRAFSARIWSAGSTEERIAATNAFLRGLSLRPDASALLATRIVREIQRERSLISVEEVARRFSMSPRSLQRLFHQYVGVTPKWVIQRFRLQEAAAALRQGEELSCLAYSLGYFDQAHFSRDFKAIVGATPAEYASQFGGSNS